MKAIIWLLDAKVEQFFAVSIGSLRENGRLFWDNNIKLVLDFGLSEYMRNFLFKIGDEGVIVCKLPLPNADDVVGGDVSNGIGVMRRRVEVTNLISSIIEQFNLSIEGIIVCDCDTVFLKSPANFPFPLKSSDISILKEWDCKDNVEYPMLLYRPSSFFNHTLPQTSRLKLICEYLSVSEEEFVRIPTYNTGVLGFLPGADFKSQWEKEYELLKTLSDENGHPIFSPYAAEQNALSLCVYKKTIKILELTKYFNQFPPRPPREWSNETVIAHFISFTRNYREPRYRLWYSVQKKVREAGFIPKTLISMIHNADN